MFRIPHKSRKLKRAFLLANFTNCAELQISYYFCIRVGPPSDSSFIYLFGVLRRFQHCTGHITTGSWKGRGNQYIQFARVVYCKLPTNGKQLPAFLLKAIMGIEPPTSEVGGESVTTLSPWPLRLSCSDLLMLHECISGLFLTLF